MLTVGVRDEKEDYERILVDLWAWRKLINIENSSGNKFKYDIYTSKYSNICPSKIFLPVSLS